MSCVSHYEHEKNYGVQLTQPKKTSTAIRLFFFCKQRVYKQLFHYYGKFIQLLWLLSLWFPELLVSVHFLILFLNPHVSNITINSKQELPDLPFAE